jgi:endonuclease/exonuclease/phosphatase family metal-dependent hydrolase
MNRTSGNLPGVSKVPRGTLRVMTLNVLHDSVRNFTRPWKDRRHLVAETIRSADPDIACLQEVSPRQLEDLGQDLPEYDVIPGTVTGATLLPGWAFVFARMIRFVFGEFLDRGELCPILLRKGRVALVQTGTQPLSPRPEGAPPPRGLIPTPHVVHWARVETRPGLTCAIHNTHLGLLPWTAQRTAAELLEILDRNWNAEPQILVGDFNALSGGRLLRSLRAGGDNGHPTLRDAWLEARERVGSGRTFHWGFGLPGPRLDYILVRPRCAVVRAMTVGGQMGHGNPSDHLALSADLELAGQ